MSNIPCCRSFEMVAVSLMALSLFAAPQPAGAQSPAKSTSKKPAAAEKPAAAATKPAAKLAEPATAEEAAKVLDLRTIPIMEGAKTRSERTLGLLMYEAKGTPKAAFEFHRQQLVKLGFKELPGGYSDKTSSSGNFTKDGFRVSLSAGEISGDPTKAESEVDHPAVPEPSVARCPDRGARGRQPRSRCGEHAAQHRIRRRDAREREHDEQRERKAHARKVRGGGYLRLSTARRRAHDVNVT